MLDKNLQKLPLTLTGDIERFKLLPKTLDNWCKLV